MSRSVSRRLLNGTENENLIRTKEPQSETKHMSGAQRDMAPVTEGSGLTENREEQRNEELNQEFQDQYPSVHVTGTADSVPVQDENPANMTFKQRRQESRKARAAREASPAGTAATYDMVAALRARDAEKRNSAAAHRDLVNRSGVDGRILRAFSRGYKERGVINVRPATEQDRINKEADDKFYEDYCTRDVKRRKPHLERIVNEMIHIHFTPDMFTERYLRSNMRQMAELSHKMMCLNNVMNDPVNAPFFEKLDPYRREALDKSFQIFIPFEAALLATLQKQGVDFNLKYGGFIDQGHKELIEDGEEMADGAVRAFLEAIGGHNETMSALEAEQKQRVRAQAKSYAARMDAGSMLMNRMKPHLGLRAGEEKGTLFRRAHVFFRMEEGAEEQNLATARTLLEVDRLNGERPSEDLYERVRDLATPRVERIMACDVDALADLTDEALMVRNEELNGLFLDSVALDDLMMIKHPSASTDKREIMLSDELVQYRQEEYSYKVRMIQGLHERARALAVRQSLENGDRSQDMFSIGERFRGQIGKPMEWVQENLTHGKMLLEKPRDNRFDIRTLGARPFQMMLRQNREDVERSVELYRTTAPLVREMDKFVNAGTVEAENIRRRLMIDHYYSLKYDEAQLKNMKVDQNEGQGFNKEIGEALFRTFSSFMSLEAARKLLTPEKAREMLRNLGAGAGIYMDKAWMEVAMDEKGLIDRNKIGSAIWVDMKEKDRAEEKRKAAIEKNDRGIAVHREIYRAQCDMLARKYGNGWDNLSLEDIVAHQYEIRLDFQESQVMMNMGDEYPDYFREKNAEDELLRNRMAYYSFVGAVMDGAVPLLNSLSRAHLFESEQQIRDELKTYLHSELLHKSAVAGEWLSANDSAFRHEVDWSQRVRVPEENAQ